MPKRLLPSSKDFGFMHILCFLVAIFAYSFANNSLIPPTEPRVAVASYGK